MPQNSAPRRTQFSSCDACRRSRVACDASTYGYRPGRVRWSGSCSRCSIRKRPCTFEWINNVKKKPPNLRAVMMPRSPRTEADILVTPGLCDQGIESNSTEMFGPRAESMDVLLKEWSDQIFHHGFETVFGILVGRNGCPFVNDKISDICIPATRLCRKLDAAMADRLDLGYPGYASEGRSPRQADNAGLDRSLNRAIQAFTARWLPLVAQTCQLGASHIEVITRDSWRTARKDMLKVINHLSYRSILALYLFAQTPIPVGISEEEELDGISGTVCMQTALLQVQKLREPQRASSASNSTLTQAYLDLESRAYWAAVMWDTSSSLTTNIRTSLTSGLNGACSEPAWRLTRTFLVGSFQPETESWRTNGFEVSDESASKIIAAAAVCKLYVWKNITSLKEALREGVDEDTVLFVWNALLDSINIFTASIRPLLHQCDRRLHFLEQSIRLGLYEVNLQYYLGILVLVNALQMANRPDLLAQVDEARQEAEHESFNVLQTGIERSYTVRGPRTDSASDLPGEPITASLIAIDPYPDHVVDFVLLTNKVISRKYSQGQINYRPYCHLSSILIKALGQLPLNSKMVQNARGALQRSLREFDALQVLGPGL